MEEAGSDVFLQTETAAAGAAEKARRPQVFLFQRESAGSVSAALVVLAGQ